MEKERELYDIFVETLIEKVKSGEATPKELEIVMNFLKNNNIQAHNSHKGLTELTKAALDLPFDDDINNQQPIRRVK